REDLYYRLNVIDLHLPPLRERGSDVGALAFHFLRKYSAENAKDVREIDDAALQALCLHHWPGNVRELENVIERAVVLASDGVITLKQLPQELQKLRATSGQGNGAVHGRPAIPGSSMTEIERYAILETLAHVGGSNAKAAEILGISVRTIQYR